ncbi:phosphate signaling complex protein PhoU [Enteractinococcus helveticum]|uniref:Phosphate-specific transport system accessory protein PhoU n=1 Tax=Enteractinococcus helveticum TaxID=1837282 RepID=A0A1B7M347_9MICC|nr:phosphate signaling complex protein PhoU [Enteractinococcus helveticum]OAV62998.1 phosphate transport system regulatory protein PhoU [Enteractinococcus helveticum]
MRKLFMAEMEAVGDDLVEMATLVNRAMKQARVALEAHDVGLAETVIAQDARIDYLQNTLDERTIELLLLQNPVATDLRLLVAALRVSSSMERMGDLARHVAALVRLRYPGHVIPEPSRPEVAEMAELAVTVSEHLERLMTSYDLAEGREIVKINNDIDILHSQIMNYVTENVWSLTAPQAQDLTLLTMRLERFGDHAVSISRKIAYLVTGEWEPPVIA